MDEPQEDAEGQREAAMSTGNSILSISSIKVQGRKTSAAPHNAALPGIKALRPVRPLRHHQAALSAPLPFLSQEMGFTMCQETLSTWNIATGLRRLSRKRALGSSLRPTQSCGWCGAAPRRPHGQQDGAWSTKSRERQYVRPVYARLAPNKRLSALRRTIFAQTRKPPNLCAPWWKKRKTCPSRRRGQQRRKACTLQKGQILCEEARMCTPRAHWRATGARIGTHRVSLAVDPTRRPKKRRDRQLVRFMYFFHPLSIVFIGNNTAIRLPLPCRRSDGQTATHVRSTCAG